jgi:2-hydroxychromene-2-carboxylate isomerase
MRGYLFVENDKKELYLDIMFDGYWKDNLDISKEENLIKLLKKCNIDENIFLEGIKDPKIKDKLKSVTKEAHDKNIFGAPTFLINNKIFWGQDRLEFALEEYSK